MVFFGYPKHKLKTLKNFITTFWNLKFIFNQN